MLRSRMCGSGLEVSHSPELMANYWLIVSGEFDLERGRKLLYRRLFGLRLQCGSRRSLPLLHHGLDRGCDETSGQEPHGGGCEVVPWSHDVDRPMAERLQSLARHAIRLVHRGEARLFDPGAFEETGAGCTGA